MIHIGIDLGTTNTSVAIARKHPRSSLVVVESVLIPDEELDGTITSKENLPSALLLPREPSDPVRVGRSALYSPVSPRRVALIKNEMDSSWQRVHHGLTWRPAEVAERFIRAAVDAVVQQFPDYDPKDGATITVPASFTPAMIAETRRAATLAGIPESTLNILNEPVAALLSMLPAWEQNNGASFELRGRLNGHSGDVTVLVFDVGGGTVDVSVVRLREYQDDQFRYRLRPEMLSVSPHTLLGGQAFDLALARTFRKNVESQHGPMSDEDFHNNWLDVWYHQTESLKKRVSNQLRSNRRDALQFSVNYSFNQRDNQSLRLNLGVNEIEDAWSDLLPTAFRPEDAAVDFERQGAILKDAKSLLEPIVYAVVRAFGSWQPNLIDAVLPVGGMSNLPTVHRFLEKHFTRERILPPADVDPSLAVSRGAALHQYHVAQGTSTLVTVLPSIELEVENARGGVTWLTLIPPGRRVQSGETYQFEIPQKFLLDEQASELILPMRLQGQRIGCCVLSSIAADGSRYTGPFALSVRFDPLQLKPELTCRFDAGTVTAALDEKRQPPVRKSSAGASPEVIAFRERQRAKFTRTAQQAGPLPSLLQADRIVRRVADWSNLTGGQQTEIANARRTILQSIAWNQPAPALTVNEQTTLIALARWAEEELSRGMATQFDPQAQRETLVTMGAFKGMLGDGAVLSLIQSSVNPKALPEKLMAIGRTARTESQWIRVLKELAPTARNSHQAHAALLWALSRSLIQADIRLTPSSRNHLESEILVLLSPAVAYGPGQMGHLENHFQIFLYALLVIRTDAPNFLNPDSVAGLELQRWLTSHSVAQQKRHGLGVENRWEQLAQLYSNEVSVASIGDSVLARLID